MKKRVVITGFGVVSPVGNTVDEFWNSVKNGNSGVGEITRFDTSEYTVKVAAEVKDFNSLEYFSAKEIKRLDDYMQYAVYAAKKAVENANIQLSEINPERMGVILGCGIGGIGSMEKWHKVLLEKGPKRMSPFAITMMIPNMAVAQVAIKTGAKGFNECISTACTSSSNAIGNAFRAIQHEDADIMITGGCEATITPLSIAGFMGTRSISTNPDPETASRPFDKERDGFVMGEGAGILILEGLEHAKARNANILAELSGYGCTGDAFHITAPAPGAEGGARSMKIAIEDAGIVPSQVDYINAHGTSTKFNDINESIAIRTIFGEDADKIPVSSTKSTTGHLIGAAGSIEAIICCKAIMDSYVPPTINYKTPDPECDLKDYVINKGRNKELNHVLSNGFGFGGHNGSLIFSKYIK